jgi:HAD superfamily hydrolase (TIGR01549 family)
VQCYISSIIFDFDGVIVESNDIRTEGFRKLLTSKHYPVESVERLIRFHETNGGLSRYYKLRYFYETILNRKISDNDLTALCNEYSTIVKNAVAKAPWVKGAPEFLKNNYSKYKLFIVSGSDQEELREICHLRGLDKFVMEIFGSPTDKKTNINNLLRLYNLSPDETLFVGDSVNDLDAAQETSLKFIARDSGNCAAWCKGQVVIKDLSQLPDVLNTVFR